MSIFNIFKKKPEARSAEQTVSTPTNVSVPGGSADVLTNSLSDSTFTGAFGKFNINSSFFQMNLSPVFRAVSLISNSIASLPIILYKVDSTGNKTPWKANSLYSILASNPNSVMTPFQFMKSIITDLLLQGNAYAMIVRNEDTAKVTALRYVPAGKVNIIKVKDKFDLISDIHYTINGYTQAVENTDMLHFINEPDADGVEGYSTISYAKRTLAIASYAETQAENFFAHGGTLNGMVKISRKMNDTQKQSTRQAWNAVMSDPNSGGVIFLDEAENYIPLQMNAQDAELLSTRKFNVDEIARFFNINPILLYDTEHNSYNSAEAAQLELLTDTLRPILDKIESELRTKLFLPSEVNKGDIKFDTTEFQRGDAKTMADYNKTLWSMGVLSINEVRASLDLNSIEGGDEHITQSNLITLDNLKNIAVSTATHDSKTGEGSSSPLDSSIAPDSSANEENKTEDASTSQSE